MFCYPMRFNDLSNVCLFSYAFQRFLSPGEILKSGNHIDNTTTTTTTTTTTATTTNNNDNNNNHNNHSNHNFGVPRQRQSLPGAAQPQRRRALGAPKRLTFQKLSTQKIYLPTCLPT